MEACLESMERKSESRYQEAPKGEAAMKTVRALKKWHGDRHLAIRCRRQPKKQTQGDGGFWKKLATACRGVFHRAGVAQHKGRLHTRLMVKQRRRKKWTRDNVARGRKVGRNLKASLE
jgi:hypothetical protein